MHLVIMVVAGGAGTASSISGSSVHMQVVAVVVMQIILIQQLVVQVVVEVLVETIQTEL
jgi:hypothetical protein